MRDNEHNLAHWQSLLQTIPEEVFCKYLSAKQDAWEGKYDAALLKQCPNLLPADVRKQMKGNIPWGAFRAIIKVLYQEASVEVVTRKLYELANFDKVKQVLQEQFFNRSKAIRCTVLLSKLNKILLLIRNDAMYSVRRVAKKSTEWEPLIRQYIRPANSAAAEELTAFIRTQVKTEADIERLDKAILEELVKPTEQLLSEIQGQNENYKMLKEVQSYREHFSQEQYGELCALFGLHREGLNDLTDEQKMKRQMFWQGKSMRYIDPKMQEIAAYAAQTYGRL